MWLLYTLLPPQKTCLLLVLVDSFPLMTRMLVSVVVVWASGHPPPVMFIIVVHGLCIVPIMSQPVPGVSLFYLLYLLGGQTFLWTRLWMSVMFLTLFFYVSFIIFLVFGMMAAATRIAAALPSLVIVFFWAFMMVFMPIFAMPAGAIRHVIYF